MTKQTHKPDLSPHGRAYVMAAALLGCAVFTALAVLAIILEVNNPTGELSVLIVAAVGLPVYYGLKWVLKVPVNGKPLAEKHQETLTTVLTVSFMFSFFEVQKGAGVWTTLTQFIGNWVVLAVVMLIVGALLDKVVARIKLWRGQRQT